MKNSVKNNIVLKLVSLKDEERKAYGHGAEYEVEISFGLSMAIVILNSSLMTIQVRSVASNESDLYDRVVELVRGKIMLSDLLLKLS